MGILFGIVTALPLILIFKSERFQYFSFVQRFILYNRLVIGIQPLHQQQLFIFRIDFGSSKRFKIVGKGHSVATDNMILKLPGLEYI